MVIIFGIEEDMLKYTIKYLDYLKAYFKDNIRRDISEFLVKTNFIDKNYVFENGIKLLYKYIFKENKITYEDCYDDKERFYYKEIFRRKKAIKFYLSDNFEIKARNFYKKAYENNYVDYPYNLVRGKYRKQIALENGIDPINCLFG